MAISAAIWHLYMVAVIAFVALQFGWIGKKDERKDDSPKESSQGEKPQIGNLLDAMMGNVMKQMGPQLKNLMEQPLPGAENAPESAPKPQIDFE